MKILLAGDNFVRNDMLAAALTATLPEPPEFASVALPWPEVPFGPVAEVNEASGSEDDLAAAIDGSEIVITQMAPLTARVLQKAPDLRLIVCTRGGPVNINVQAAADRGVAVCCTPGRNAVAAAEYSLLLMMAAMRRLPAAHTSLAAGQWRSEMYAYDECGSEIAGAVVGVVGFGEIGRRVTGLLRWLGGHVLAHDPFVSPSDVDGETELVPLDTLLRRADVVTLHARLTPETTGMIGAAQLSLMRPGAVLVNTARGALLDYRAAREALVAGSLRALALDVFPTEPVDPDLALLSTPGVVLSPHLAGATKQAAERAAGMAAAEVLRYVHRDPLAHQVNDVEIAGANREVRR